MTDRQRAISQAKNAYRLWVTRAVRCQGWHGYTEGVGYIYDSKQFNKRVLLKSNGALIMVMSLEVEDA